MALQNKRMLKRTHMRNTPYRKHGHRGFSMIELMIVVVAGIILTAMAVPTFRTIQRNLRTGGDARDINGQIVLAKMRAAADFTKTRVYADLSDQTFRIEAWKKSGGGSWGIEGATQRLSQDVTLGFGNLSSPPSGTQATIGQAPACLDNSGTAIANTACIVFNSRGIPVDSTGTPTAKDAIYITDGTSVYGLTVSPTGLIQEWRSGTDATNWQRR